METIYVSDVLKDYGIDILTGEACALSMRLLCELDQPMMETYLAYTGFKVDLDSIQKSHYNNHNKWSVFLTHEVMEDLIIMRLMDKFEIVVEILPIKQEGFSCRKFLLVGNTDEVKDYINEHFENSKNSFYEVGRTYWIYQPQPRRGFSNIHAFTGMSQ